MLAETLVNQLRILPGPKEQNTTQTQQVGKKIIFHLLEIYRQCTLYKDIEKDKSQNIAVHIRVCMFTFMCLKGYI